MHISSAITWCERATLAIHLLGTKWVLAHDINHVLLLSMHILLHVCF